MGRTWSNRGHLPDDYIQKRYERGHGKSYHEVAKRDRKTGRVTIKNWIEY